MSICLFVCLSVYLFVCLFFAVAVAVTVDLTVSFCRQSLLTVDVVGVGGSAGTDYCW